MKTETLKALLTMLPIASNDQIRYHMSGVYLRMENGKLSATVTDGHCLLHRIFDDKIPDGKYMLYRDDAPAIKLVLREMKRINEIDFSIDSSGRLIGGISTLCRISKYESEFPEYEKVIPKPYRNEASITLNAELLLDIAKAVLLSDRAKPEIRLVFDATSNLNPIRLERGENNDFTALLMPVKDEKANKIANYMKTKLETRKSGVTC